jgi:hypothetical protein
MWNWTQNLREENMIKKVFKKPESYSKMRVIWSSCYCFISYEKCVAELKNILKLPRWLNKVSSFSRTLNRNIFSGDEECYKGFLLWLGLNVRKFVPLYPIPFWTLENFHFFPNQLIRTSLSTVPSKVKRWKKHHAHKGQHGTAFKIRY